MPDILVQAIGGAAPDLIALQAESVAQGFGMVRRLREDWTDGSNRFDRPGEALLGAYAEGQLVGVGGLNVDPYLADPAVGRLRHMYVLDSYRRHRVGAALVGKLLSGASGHFTVVRLWTGQAHAFYEALGFTRVDEPKATHRIVVRPRPHPLSP